MIQPQCQLEEKSPVKGDLHAGICGSRGVRFPSATRLPVGSGLPALRQIAAAKAVCARCPVISACLMSALGRDEKGVWGGLSEDERSAIRRRAAAGRTPRVHARSVGRVIECTPAQG